MRVAFQEGFKRAGGRVQTVPLFRCLNRGAQLHTPGSSTNAQSQPDVPWTGLPLSPQVAKYQFRPSTKRPESTIRTAIEKRSIRPSSSRVGKSIRYEFDLDELLFMKLLTEFPFSLPKEDKRSLRQLVGKSSGSVGRWKMHGPNLLMKKGDLSVSVHYHPLRKQLMQNANLYRKGADRIVSDPEVLGGERVFKGTRIPLEHLAGLVRKGVSEAEIREDYPALSHLDLAF